jgi:hypothetical protein
LITHNVKDLAPELGVARSPAGITPVASS